MLQNGRIGFAYPPVKVEKPNCLPGEVCTEDSGHKALELFLKQPLASPSKENRISYCGGAEYGQFAINGYVIEDLSENVVLSLVGDSKNTSGRLTTDEGGV